MQSFKATVATAVPLNSSDLYCHSSFYLRGGDDSSRSHTRFADLGELEQAAGFHQEDAVDLSRSSIYNDLKPGNVAVVASNLQFGVPNTNFSSTEMGTGVDTGQFMLQKGVGLGVGGGGCLGNGHFDNWGESGIADNSQQTDDTSTDVDTDDRNQYPGVQHGAQVDSMYQPHGRTGDQKTLRRLTQNREAARKSRLRKKGVLAASGYSANPNHSVGGNVIAGVPFSKSAKRVLQCIELHELVGGALAFDMDYARWRDEQERLISDLRSAVNSHMGDNELRLLVDGVMSHYDEIFRLKSIGAKSDVFHMLSGMWKTPAERCFMWLGGFRSSELLKILGNHLEPLTDQQLMGICNLQQSSQQAEDALSQGMEALQQSLAETLSSNSTGPGNMADYMGQMAIAMGKLATIENFLYQADLLRQQTLQQMHRILTTRQAACALLVINDYTSRLRALSSLWLARPKD
ncbi:hypothetical protein RJ639_034539 [Escallonia herrerae]|uniref:DOG1 domain-containing protein n=1 Tax=Escallonia herrerae TaxID=1293975 RepID=A0AA89B9P4_9ASTE|nr:hypothetical protein RJ639_034539 [Escallonia herrerae]